MERKLGRLPVIIVAALSAAAAYGLRLHQLQTGYELAIDGVNRVIHGTGNTFFTWFTIAMVIVFGVYAYLLKKRMKFSALGRFNLPEAVLSCIAAFGLLMGSAAMLLSPEAAIDRLLGLGGMISAVCWVGAAMFQFRGKKPSVYLYLIPVLFFAVMLVVDFRVWSRDPEVIDYCYDLFALISVMCALFYLSGFSLDRGYRRMAVFFLLCGLFFCAASMAGAQLRHVCILGGAMLWMAVNLWRLLRPGRKQPETAET